MFQPLELIRLQIALEYDLDGDGLLIPFPSSSEHSLYIVYHYSDGYVPYFNHYLPAALRYGLLQAGLEKAFDDPNIIEMIIGDFSECHCEGRFVSEYIPQVVQTDGFDRAVLIDGQWVILLDGSPVCRAWSERSNDRCAEVAVETEPEFRKRGYARQASSAWAKDVIQSGGIAFYSYQAENVASAALAHRLGTVWYADVVGYA